MAKAKKGKGGGAKKGKKKAGKRGGGAPTRSYSSEAMAAAMEICSFTNPFCPEALNGKYPDGSYVKTNVWSVNGASTSIGVNASGDGAILFLPNAWQQYVNASTVAGDTITTAATSNALVTFPSGVNRWRLTSWGLKIQCLTSAMTTTGVCQMRGYSVMDNSALATYDKGSTMADFAQDVPLSRMIGTDYFIVPMALGRDAREWRSSTTYSTNAWQGLTNPGWQTISIGVSGGLASTQVLRVYAYYHYELIFNDGDSAINYATPPPPMSMAKQEAGSGVLARIGGAIEGTAKKIDAIAQSSAFRYAKALAVAVATRNPNVGMMMLTDRKGREVD